MKRMLQALLIGSTITLGLFGAAYLAAAQGQMDLSYGLYWQAWYLQSLVPCEGVPLDPNLACEVTTAHVLSFYAGIPLGIVLYSLLAYVGLVAIKRKRG